jgi:anti-sigma factor RsiW
MPKSDEIEELTLLLPFYVNGTLDAEACARVDAALAHSADLRVELATLNRLARSVKEGGRGMNEGADNKEQHLAKVTEAIKAHEKRSAPMAAMPPTDLGEAKGGSGFSALLGFLHPRRWHPAIALSMAIAIPAQAAVIANLNSEKSRSVTQIAALEKRLGELEFQLASGPGGGAAQRGTIMIQLNDDAGWSSIAALLAAEELSIVDGPSDDSLTLHSTAKGAALDAQIKRLRASTLIAAADKVA